MKALQRKLLRDLWRMRAQVVTVALAVACGVTAYVASVATWRSLKLSRDRTYRLLRFADVFARVQGAPDRVLDELRAIPGVAVVEGRVSDTVRVEVPDDATLARGLFLSLRPGATLNQLFLREGRLPERPDEVVVNELFAQAHGLRPGSTLFATFAGRRARLVVSGSGLAPDHLWIIGEGAGFGDERRFGVFWMRDDALSPALGLDGEFTDVSIALAPGASSASVVDAVDRWLASYGSFGAQDRALQLSHRLVTQEIGQLRGSATVLPAVFLAVAAFLVHVLLSRIVGLQREQIATLKAFGYGNGALARHYLALGLTMVVPGTLLGVGLGAWVGNAFLGIYEEYFRFVDLRLELEPRVIATGAGISIGAAIVGALSAVRHAARLAPAEAMRPEAPPSFRATLVERLGLDRLFTVAWRMVVRDLERHRWRTLFSALGVAGATSLLVAGNAAFDSFEVLIRHQFEQAQREDFAVQFGKALSLRAVETIAGMPGVIRAEPQRTVAVRLRSPRHSREAQLTVLFEGATLRRLLDVRGARVELPARGLVLSRVLADRLGVAPGDLVDVELLEEGRKRRTLRLARVLDDTFGLNAYLSEADFSAAMDETPLASEVLLRVDRSRLGPLETALTAFPWVTTVNRPEVARDLFRRQSAEIFLTYQAVLAAFAIVIAVGVVYNNARIALLTRSRDLASLRILGFSRGEVGAILVGEQMVQLLMGIPIGLPIGAFLARVAMSSADPEIYRLPAEASARTLAMAAVVVFAAGLASTFVVRRGLKRLDLVAVLKARD